MEKLISKHIAKQIIQEVFEQNPMKRMNYAIDNDVGIL